MENLRVSSTRSRPNAVPARTAESPCSRHEGRGRAMAIPTGLPLVGGADPWVVLGPVTVLSVAGGWLLAQIDRRLRITTTVETPRSKAEEVLRPAA